LVHLAIHGKRLEGGEVDALVGLSIDVIDGHQALVRSLVSRLATLECRSHSEASIEGLEGVVGSLDERHSEHTTSTLGTVVLENLDGLGGVDDLDAHGKVLLGWL